MKVQFELVQIKGKGEAPALSSISSQTQRQVLRLLSKQSRVRQTAQRVQRPPWVYVDPLSRKALCWYILYLLFFYLIQLQISMSLAFGADFFQNQLKLGSFYFPLYVSTLTFLGLDMALSFFRGYYAYGKGKVVQQWQHVKTHQLTTQFPFDFLAFALYAVPLVQTSRQLNFLQLVPGVVFWVKKSKYQGHIESILQFNANLRAFFLALMLFADVLLVGNYGACLFIGIDLLLYRLQYYGAEGSFYWLTDNTLYSQSLMDGPWYLQYVYGQAFASGTLSTLAPGPFARNPWQILYGIFAMMLFMLLASYAAEVIIQIYYAHTERRIFHEENIISFDNLMQLKQVARHVRRRIYNFFELVWEVQLKMETQQQQAMLQKLPPFLTHQLLQEIAFTKHLPFLHYLSPPQNSLQQMLALQIHRSTIDSDTCIFESGKTLPGEQRRVIYIKQGMAKFYIQERTFPSVPNSQKAAKNSKIGEKEIILALSNVQEVLGVYEFVTGQSYAMCCKSVDLCLIQSLSWTAFQKIVQQLQIEQQFQQLKHKVLYERQLQHIEKHCVVCLSDHIESECPDIYPKFGFLRRMQKGEFGSENKRVVRKRREGKSRKVVAIELERGQAESILSFMPNIDLGNLLLEMGKMDKSYEKQFEQLALYQHYFPAHNISTQL